MIEAAFRAAMDNAGLTSLDPVIADSRLHRFRVDGDKTGSRNGWYIIFSGDFPCGAFGSWKTGFKHSWCLRENSGLTPSERTAYRVQMEAARKAREREEQRVKKAARDKAAYIWRNSSPAGHCHSYLIKKGVKSYGLRLSRNALVIPLRDSDGALHSLQFIDDNGQKRFLTGGRKRGCYFSIGAPKDKICIAEGYATAASIHEATGHAVAVAFDAGNLRLVAQALRRKFPDVEMILCADNDAQTPGNPGLTNARDAAAAVGGLVTMAGD